MEKILFADAFKKSFKNLLKVPVVTTDDPVFRLHYKVTGITLFFCSIMVSVTQFFGEPIMCIQKDDIPEQLLNTYCWIEGSFTLPKALTKQVGVEVVYPGVDKYQKGDEVIEHAYYQWVCFVLLLQACMFSVPFLIWSSMEGGRMKNLIQKLRKPVIVEEKEGETELAYDNLAKYFIGRRGQHQIYALKFIFCEVLTFVNVIGQLYFINKFLGGQFLRYGTNVINFINDEQENRSDPMIRIFPRITKCTFHRYGSSGDVQKHDALCLLPLNILNEKIFVIMWFWFIILAVLGGGVLIYRLIIFLSDRSRFWLLNSVASLTSKGDINSLIQRFTYGDWFVLYLLADNIDNIHFHQVVERLINPKKEYFIKELDSSPTVKLKEMEAEELKALVSKDESTV